MSAPTASATSFLRRIADQSALLLGGFAGAQACSLLRNAMLGHMLAKGDFGVAMTILLTLQLLETATDVAADRFLVQADDAEDRRLMGAAHAILLARALLIGCVLWLLAPLAAAFFRIETAEWAFRAAAVTLVIKGFMHLDWRRRQRHLDNRAAVAVELWPQAATLALTWPFVNLWPGYEAVVWLSLFQALATVAVSQLVAERPWRIALDRGHLVRMAAFSWPIWLSAFPLMAVYQGDRAVVGRFLGMEALAGYTAAFLVTMVPGLIASRVAFSLLLPMLSTAKADRAAFAARLGLMSEAGALFAGLYLIGLAAAGGPLLALAFGRGYAGLGELVAALAAMWAVRMLQAVPGTALMAVGETRPYLVAGIIRSLALAPALWLATQGASLAAIALAGAAGEIASFGYVLGRLARTRPVGARAMLRSGVILGLAFVVTGTFLALSEPASGLLAAVAQAIGLCAAFLLASLPLLAEMRRQISHRDRAIEAMA
jgi:O-antigen/teichoic acid export membrane protein